jgi:thiamine pyrophosphate-dependent acetolactate synthase large subunit-like protein
VPKGAEAPEARIIRIGMDTAAMGRNYATDVALIGDVSEALKDLRKAVESQVPKGKLAALGQARGMEAREISAARNRAMAAARKNFGQSPMHPDEIGAVLAGAIDPDAIFVSENLTGRHDAFAFGFREKEQWWIGNTGASLGWGVGAATGAKLAAPDRQVICSIGDGSVMYSAAGFWTQARYGIPVLTVVWNNKNYQTVRHAYHGYGGKMATSGHYAGMYLGDPDIDFVKLGESQGVRGEKAGDAASLRAALKRGVAATRDGKPYLVEMAAARYGGGAESTWHESFDLAAKRKRKA